MREILFKAKRKDNGEWVEGYYLKYIKPSNGEIEHRIFVSDGDGVTWYTVTEDTLCQYTGLTDKNGKKIWENDIVNVESGAMGSPYFDGMIGKIIFTECAFFVEPNNKAESTWLFDECAEHEVLGNIFDNPELMKGEEHETD